MLQFFQKNDVWALMKHCVKSVRIRISSYSVQMRENAVQNNSEYGHFLRSKEDSISR